LNVDNLADVVEHFEAVDELAAGLWMVESRDHVGQELILYAEVALKMKVEELEKLLLQLLGRPALGKRKVLVVCELTEVLRKDVFKVVEHFVEG